MLDYDCPKCESKNSVEVTTASVLGDSIELRLGCKKCGETAPYVRCDVDTVDMKKVYTNWYKSFEDGK